MSERDARAEYEGNWGNISKFVDALLDQGEDDLGRLMNLTEYHWRDTVVQEEAFIAKAFDIPRDERNVPTARLSVVRGEYTRVPRYFLDYTIVNSVVGRLTKDTDMVVELGCGWGRILFRVFLHSPFPDLSYVGCELTTSGRNTLKRIGGAFSKVKLDVHAFDYRTPDLSFIEGNPNVVFYTSQSIEQIKYLNPSLFDQMLERTNKCTCVHMEPVGWQRDAACRQFVEQTLKLPYEDRLKLATSFEPADYNNESLLKNAAIWSLSHDYNVDLLKTLVAFQDAGKIRLRHLDYDFYGYNPLNPCTLVVWDKA